MPHVTSINISEKKGTPKHPVLSATLKEDWGLVGDAHAGLGIRQVSLLSQSEINEFMKNPKLKVPLTPGIFGENLAIIGIDFSRLKIGVRLKIGNDAILEISKLGKECEVPCAIGKTTGDCIMPKKGVFAIVVKGGIINKGDSVEFD
jgi:MOSC domain-containing protein YiiM